MQTVGDTLGPGDLFRGEAREISLSDADGDTDPFTNTWGFRTELCRLYGYLPAAGDRHVCEFLPGYLRDEKKRERLDLRVTTVDVRRERLAADRERVGRMIRGEESVPSGRSREEISDIMAAMWTGEDSVNIVNLPNAGQVWDLPLGAVVETYGALNGAGGFWHRFRGAPPTDSRARPPSRLQPGGDRAGRSDRRYGASFPRLL